MALIRLRFRMVDGGKVAMDYQWDTDGEWWWPFGDPVPFDEGPHKGFGVHDLYHFALMAESGWSEVLEQLMAGKNDGVFGGIDALREEAVILDRYLSASNSIAKSCALLGYRVNRAALGRAMSRGDAVRDEVRERLLDGKRPTCTIELPESFKDRSVAHRRATRVEPVGRKDELF